MTLAGKRLAMVVEEMVVEMEAAGEHARALSLRGDVEQIRTDTVRGLDLERMARICGGLSWITGHVPSVSKAERLRRKLEQALEGARQ